MNFRFDKITVIKMDPNVSNDVTDVSSEYKLIHKLCFRCLTCMKSYSTEDGVKKHLGMIHGFLTPTSIHFTSYVGQKRVKLSKPKEEPSRVIKPSVAQNKSREPKRKPLASSSVSCSVCDKVFNSCDDVKSHLKSDHGVKEEITPDMFSYNFYPKPGSKQAKFITPLLANKQNEVSQPNETQDGSNDDLTGNTSDNKSNSVKKRHDKSKGEKNVRKKSNIGFCKSLTNMFSTGTVKMEKLGLWKNLKIPKNKTSNNNNQHQSQNDNSQSQVNLTQSQNTTAEAESTNIQFEVSKVQPMSTSIQSEENKESEDINKESEKTNNEMENSSNKTEYTSEESVHNINETMNTDHKSQNINNEYQKNNNLSQNTSIQFHNTDDKNQQKHQDSNSQSRDIQNLFETEFPGPALPAPSSSPARLPGTGAAIKARMQRKKKSCGVSDCMPCSLVQDCLVCRFCQNKNLK